MNWPLSAFADEAGPSAEEQIAALRDAKLAYIDIRNIDGQNITALPIEAARVLRKKLDAARIKVGMYGSPIGKIDITEDFEIDLNRLRHLGELRPVLGSSDVRIFSYYNKTNRPKEEFRAEVFRRLEKLKTLAAHLGLILYHENELHIFGDKAADVLELARKFRDGPDGRFQMIFDFGNYHATGEDPWQNWLLLRENTDAIHIKDNMHVDGKLIHVPGGQGAGKIPEILADAARHRWIGPVVVEPHLQHSAAVMATGPSGAANQAYSAMSGAESFKLACEQAKKVILAAGARAI